jgi:tRNA modification GTPase
MDLDDTIAAIASAPGGALRGIVRVSGPRCLTCVEQVFEPAEERVLSQLRAASCLRGEIRLPRGLGRVPATLYLWPTERSYTHQPSAELHLPGSPPLVEAALEAICTAGARLARAGEFTLRAFLAGRLDLTQAEAVLAVIDARGRAELDVALAQLAGGLAQPLRSLRDELLDLLAHLEAGLDFVEEDIEFIDRKQLETQLAAAAERVDRIAAQMQARGQSGQLPRVVLVGPPNAGKSSLLNCLAGSAAAIVSDIAGTTRDFVARRISLPGGEECLLIDTAGLVADARPGSISDAAQEAARRQIDEADLTLLCLDAAIGHDHGAVATADPCGAEPARPPQIVVWTKCDSLSPAEAGRLPMGGLKTSSRTGEGRGALRQAIAAALESRRTEPVVAGTADRCRESLRLASAALARARQAAEASVGEELVAAEVRLALDELGLVVGAVYTDDVLDRVFSRFCIGK